jgi:unsaturated chondroitin disaccharide hydrolase
MTTTRPGLTRCTFDQVRDVASEKLTRLVEHHRGQIPVHTIDGKWEFQGDPWAPPWTAGFLTGQLWIMASWTGDPAWRELAEQYSHHVAERRFDTGTHDIGFLFTPSWGRWRKHEDTDEVRAVLVDAGRSLASRFNPAGGYLSTWVDPGSTFIDVMMNLDVIFEAAEICGDPSLRRIAHVHATTSRRHLVRADGTTIHEGWFDPQSGEFLRPATHQGYRSDSSWVRGQTWAMYGFCDAYRRTGDLAFLDTAKNIANSYLALSRCALPPNDWQEPSPTLPVEASSAAIAAAGLARIGATLGEAGSAYLEAARRTVELLCDPAYLSIDDPQWEGIIRHAIYHEKKAVGVDESVMWGDYYFLEAVEQLHDLGVLT